MISPERRPTLAAAKPRDNASAPETLPILEIDSLHLKQMVFCAAVTFFRHKVEVRIQQINVTVFD